MKNEKQNQKEKTMNLETALTKNRQDPGFWREIWQQMRLVYYLIRDPEVPIYLKLLPLAAVVYLLWPIDFITDFAPFLGQLDDLTALLVSSKVFVELSPPEVVARHMTAIREQDGFAPADKDGRSPQDVADAIIINGDHEVVTDDPDKKAS